ncbi:predicted protein [Naegleria gruberi]|uniref:Predicted protein n=1 Tax=Naegleria gruberi TaxID=5762 RepID=D2V9L9_NAEGR|nr:uncharacterized protein NAEGRDRAFT_65486 [Naegleria gruberi]EFC46486.1 predicted protein [Naegleria gruberi]|eukprot:XP_002679230.1 predicted protein [Naegleria gruberi strain NEG-M]
MERREQVFSSIEWLREESEKHSIRDEVEKEYKEKVKALENTIEELKKRLDDKNNEIDKCVVSSNRMIETELENQKLREENNLLMGKQSEYDREIKSVLEFYERRFITVNEDVEAKLLHFENNVIAPLMNNVSQAETSLKKALSVGHKLRSERNDLRQRCSQLLSQLRSRTEELDKLQMDHDQIQTRNEENLQKVKMQYEQKMLQLNTKINAERTSYSSSGQTAIEMYKKKLQAAELQIKELKKGQKK